MYKIWQTCLSKGWGGLEMVALETAQNLQEQGFQTKTLVLKNSELSRQFEKNDLEVLGIEPRTKLPWARLRLFRHMLRKEKPDLILVQHLSDLWLVVPGLIGFPEIRVIGFSHTFLGVSKKDPWHFFLYRRIYQLIALTHRHRENLSQNLPLPENKIRVLPNSVDVHKFNPHLRDEKIREHLGASESTVLIGVVSRLDPGKGLIEAVIAAENLKRSLLDFRLVFIGQETLHQPGMRKKLEEEIARRNLQKEVSLAGHFSDLPPVMASLDILLMPAPQETFGRVILEAMASGVPVVACRGGGVSDILRQGEDGLLVPSGDSLEMARALQSLILHPLRRRRLREMGLATVLRFYEKNQILSELGCLLRDGIRARSKDFFLIANSEERRAKSRGLFPSLLDLPSRNDLRWVSRDQKRPSNPHP